METNDKHLAKSNGQGSAESSYLGLVETKGEGLIEMQGGAPKLPSLGSLLAGTIY